jgi:hypothetical protein
VDGRSICAACGDMVGCKVGVAEICGANGFSIGIGWRQEMEEPKPQHHCRSVPSDFDPADTEQACSHVRTHSEGRVPRATGKESAHTAPRR